MITTQEVSDLREGDVVELTLEDGQGYGNTWGGTTIRGPLRVQLDELWVGGFMVRNTFGDPAQPRDRSLKVIERQQRWRTQTLKVSVPNDWRLPATVLRDVIRESTELLPEERNQIKIEVVYE